MNFLFSIYIYIYTPPPPAALNTNKQNKLGIRIGVDEQRVITTAQVNTSMVRLHIFKCKGFVYYARKYSVYRANMSVRYNSSVMVEDC